MPTVKKEASSNSELDGATPATPSSSGPSVQPRSLGTMAIGVQKQVKTEHLSESEKNESEEDRVARRREQWRLKKREQRAKMAARLGKTRKKVTPVITASAHFLLDANKSSQTQSQTLRKSARMVKESAREPPNVVPPSTIPRCRTPWQRSLEAQRLKKMRSIPLMDNRDTPEQIIAKKREYWRIKKREQRAKMSMEEKEKDSLIRRVRRYQNILKEMRRVRALEGSLETIGGFIKEDGTVSASVSQMQSLNGIARKHKLGASDTKVLTRAPTRSSKTTPVQAHSHLTLTCPQNQRKPGFSNAAPRVGRAGCIMKMLVSDKTLSKEDRMAKKREYWRVAKRQQRAAQAARLRQGFAEARLGLGVQRNNSLRPAYQALSLNASEPTHPIKQEPDLNPAPEQDFCPNLKPPLWVPKPQPDPARASDSQATTLLAVASMKKLLEESLSTVNDDKEEEHYITTKVKEEPDESDIQDEPDKSAFQDEPDKLEFQDEPDNLEFQDEHDKSEFQDEADKSDFQDKPGESEVQDEPNESELQEEPDRTEVAPVVRQRCPGAASSLQKKREYWKLMKRQQRARKKERQGKAGAGHCGGGGRSLPLRNNQAPALAVRSINVAKTLVKILPKPSSLESRIPAESLKPPIVGYCADLDPALPALKPPDNPLSGIILHPIEPPAQNLNPTPLKHSWSPPAPLSNIRPPKRRPEESEDDFLKRRREYWRIKKKELRARKSAGEKGIPQRMRQSSVPHAQNLQNFCQQPISDPLSEAPEHFISNSVDARNNSHYPAPLEGNTLTDELLLADDECLAGEEGPVSEATWRNVYLMDYDPLNQLLVCMACGQLQHLQSLDGVLAHIDEAHPHTRALEPDQRRRILEAWDEQVSRRERFFTRQLLQRDATLAETHRD